MERASVTIANGFNNSAVAVTYIAIFKHPHFFKLAEGIDFYEPNDFNHSKLSFLKTLMWIRKIIKKENPDSILVYNKFLGAVAVTALLATKFNIFISERSSPLYPWPVKIKIMNRIAFTLNAPTGVMAQTTIASEYQKKYYRNNVNIAVIPNALRKINLYPKLPREKVILGVGRLSEFNKGFDRLLAAFSNIENKQWKLKLMGATKNIDDLKTQAIKLGINNRIDFIEPTNTMDQAYATAGIFVIPSRSEGFPNALCEAMAAGLPCISFDFMAGPKDIITDGFDGYIIKEGAINLLAKKIDELINDKDLRNRIGYNAMEIRERYSQEKISKQVLSFISSS